MPIIGDNPHLTHEYDDTYVMYDDMLYRDPLTNELYEIRAPFKWDMGTIIKFVPRIIVPHSDEMTYPSALHDKFYRTYEVTRREADAIFRRFMIEEGMSKTRAWIAWGAVRLNLKAEFRWGKE